MSEMDELTLSAPPEEPTFIVKMKKKAQEAMENPEESVPCPRCVRDNVQAPVLLRKGSTPGGYCSHCRRLQKRERKEEKRKEIGERGRGEERGEKTAEEKKTG